MLDVPNPAIEAASVKLPRHKDEFFFTRGFDSPCLWEFAFLLVLF